MNPYKRILAEPWFCDDPDGEGLTWWATEAEALKNAEECIAAWKQDGEEWPSEVDIIVGCATYRAQQVNIQRPSSELDDEGFDSEGVYWPRLDDYYRCDYAMQPLGNMPKGEAA